MLSSLFPPPPTSSHFVFSSCPSSLVHTCRFKTGCPFVETVFSLDIKAAEKSINIITAWNAAGFVNQAVRMNEPQVWTFQPGSRSAGQKVLQEPFIENWQKFNSNTGWKDDSLQWSRVMQALSHFSYHTSGGQFVLCDLQGGVYSNGVVLTDPVILSRSGQYGVTDLGSKGISSFFATHKCNEFCKADWATPKDTAQYYNVMKRTSMDGAMSGRGHVSNRGSRPAMTAWQDEDDEDNSDSDGY